MTINLSAFSASFEDYKLDINYYHGKDLVHQGCLLKLDPDYSWERISSKIRNKIRKAQQLDINIKRVKGTKKNILDFRTIWFDPDDVTIPEHLESDEIMYLAYDGEELTGGLILTPSSPTVLYMHNLGSDEKGKRNNIPALLLWHAVNDLKDSNYEYIDVGVSFRPTLYTFFKNWQTDTYPIIFTPPFIRPDLRLTPFSNNDLVSYRGQNHRGKKIADEYFGEQHTVLPRAIYALRTILQHVGVTKKDNVAVYSTFDTGYLSRCVSEPIEALTKLTNKIDKNTKAVVVVHEFGFPHPKLKELKKQCAKLNIPLIEDCAWSYGSKVDAKTKIGEVGDYAIYSLPKILPMQYGAILKGLAIPDEEVWSTYQLLDYFKREIVYMQLEKLLPTMKASERQRTKNWHYLQNLFAKDGFRAFTELKDGVIPGAFLLAHDDFNKVFERYLEFGVETGRFYQASSLYLPIHQNLTENQLDYIYGVHRGLLNLSSNYRRDKKQ